MNKKICILQPSQSLVEPSVFERNAMATMKIDAVYFKGEDGEFHLLGVAEENPLDECSPYHNIKNGSYRR